MCLDLSHHVIGTKVLHDHRKCIGLVLVQIAFYSEILLHLSFGKHIEHLLLCFMLLVFLQLGNLWLGHLTRQIDKLFISEGFGNVMSIFEVALDIEEVCSLTLV